MEMQGWVQYEPARDSKTVTEGQVAQFWKMDSHYKNLAHIGPAIVTSINENGDIGLLIWNGKQPEQKIFTAADIASGEYAIEILTGDECY